MIYSSFTSCLLQKFGTKIVLVLSRFLGELICFSIPNCCPSLIANTGFQRQILLQIQNSLSEKKFTHQLKFPVNCKQGNSPFLQNFCVHVCSWELWLPAPLWRTWQGQWQPSPITREGSQTSQLRTREIKMKDTLVGRAAVWAYIS